MGDLRLAGGDGVDLACRRRGPGVSPRLLVQRPLAMTNPAESRRHVVILDLPDRIELVIVATGAVEGQTEEGLPHGADDVFQLILPHHALHGGALLSLTD